MTQVTQKSSLNRRLLRVRSKLLGTAKRPRLTVRRSNKHIQAQLIDDQKHVTLAGLSTKTLSPKTKVTKTKLAFSLGEALGALAIKKGIKAAIFDRGSYRYHGRVKAVAEGARSSGLKI